MLESNARILGGEVSVGFGVMGITVGLPSGDCAGQRLFIWNAAVEALGGLDAQFGFREIEPLPCLSV